MFKDKQAREEIARLDKDTKNEFDVLLERICALESLFGVHTAPTMLYPFKKESRFINRFKKLTDFLNLEYKEESKEAGWVKKELPENVTTNDIPSDGVSCAGMMTYKWKPKKNKRK